MKTALLLLFLNFYIVLVLLTKPGTGFKKRRERDSNPGNFFMQKLDHFNRGDNQKWRQRYWNHSSMYKAGGPAFLFVNGEGDASSDFNIGQGYYWLSYAEALNAYCFSLEHRFYGKSWPENGNMMRYLSSKQAVADIAYFIHIAPRKFNLPQDIKWILFGCSYAGSLAAWTRLKYPHLVFGAVASGAPLLAKADFSEYQEVVEQSLSSYHPTCLENTASAVQQVMDSKNATRRLIKIFGLSSDEKDANNILNEVLFKVQNVFKNAVQHNDIIQINVSTVCDTMINATLKRNKRKYLAKVIKLSDELGGDDDEDDITDNEPWLYQMCSEFGFFRSISVTSSLFGGNYSVSAEELVEEHCRDFFGIEFSFDDINERVLQTNTYYGGLDFNVDRTVFVHGSYDPWHALGLHEMKPDSLYKTIFINGTQCAEAYYPTEDRNISEVADARKQILEILKFWLKKNL